MIAVGHRAAPATYTPMESLLRTFYKRIRLNLGIKTTLERYAWEINAFVHNRIVYPLYELLVTYITRRVNYHYGGDYRLNFGRSQNMDIRRNNLGYGLLHYAMARNLRPKRVLCIGSMYGFVPYMLARACQDNGIGHVDFVDAGYDINDKSDRDRHFFGVGFWKYTDAKRHFQFMLSEKYITTYIMTSTEFAKKYKYRYDYIHFDGDHTYAGAKRDLKTFWPRLTDGGFAIFHDIYIDKVRFGVAIDFWKIWRDLKSMPFKFEMPTRFSGLGFLQKQKGVRLPKGF